MGAPHALLSVKMCGRTSVFAAAWCTRSASAIPAFNVRLKTRLVEEFFSPSRGLKPELWAPLAAPQGASLAFCALLGGGLHPLIPVLLNRNGPVQGPV